MSLRTVFAPALWVGALHVKLARTVCAQVGHVPYSFRVLMWLCGLMNAALAGMSIAFVDMFSRSEEPQHQMATGDALQLLLMTYVLFCLGVGFWIAAREMPYIKKDQAG